NAADELRRGLAAAALLEWATPAIARGAGASAPIRSCGAKAAGTADSAAGAMRSDGARAPVRGLVVAEASPGGGGAGAKGSDHAPEGAVAQSARRSAACRG